MFLAKVLGPVVCSVKHPALIGRPLLLVQPITENDVTDGDYHLAVDYIGAGSGDIVVAGGPPGLGASFGMEKSPISTWVMGIVDSVNNLSGKVGR